MGSMVIHSLRRRPPTVVPPRHHRVVSCAAERVDAYDAGDRAPDADARCPSDGTGDAGTVDPATTAEDDPRLTEYDAAAAACRRAGRADVDALDADQVSAGLRSLQQATSALTAARARLLRAAERLQVHEAEGANDMVSWVRGEFDMSAREAKAQAELGRSLEELPETEEALTEGRIGPDKAVTIARAARGGRLGDPTATEARLLPEAHGAPERFARHVRDAEQEADGDLLRRDEQRARARRQCNVFERADGLVELRALLDSVSAEYVRAGLDAFEAPDPADTPPGRRRRPEQRRADALVQMARAALDAGTAPTNGGVRPHVSVVIDADQLADLHGTGGTAASGTQLSTAAVRRLLCDASVTRVVMAGPSQVLDVGRATQSWNPAQRRAIVARDGRCRGPYCDRPASWCDIHHVRWWDRDEGPTAVTNGLLLCDADHDRVHSGGWTVELDATTGIATWTSPAGKVVRTDPRRGPRGGAGRRRTS